MRITQLPILITTTLLTMPVSADINQEIGELSLEKRKITMQVSKMFYDKKLGSDPGYKAAQKAAHDAIRASLTAQRSHPRLKELCAKSNAAQKKLINALVAKDDEVAKVARKAFTECQIEIGMAVLDIPELVELEEKALKACKSSHDKKKQLLATTTEGKELVSKIDALEAKIAELRKKAIPSKP